MAVKNTLDGRFEPTIEFDGKLIEITDEELAYRRQMTKKYGCELNIRHKQVIRYMVDGLSRSEAYMRVYKGCHSKATARSSMAKILYNPEAIEYYNSLVKERQDYIQFDKRLTLNDLSGNLLYAIKECKDVIKETRFGKSADRLNAIKTLITGVEKYATIIGVGNFDAGHKLKFFEEQERIKNEMRSHLKEEELRKLNSIGCSDNNNKNNSEIIDVTEDMLDDVLK